MQKMRLYIIVIIVFIVGFSTVGWSQKKAKEKSVEKSFKTGKNEPRYLKTFKPLTLPQNTFTTIDGEDLEASVHQQVDEKVNQVIEILQSYEWLNTFNNQALLISFVDLSNYRLKIEYNDGDIKMTKGFKNEDKGWFFELNFYELDEWVNQLGDGQADSETKLFLTKQLFPYLIKGFLNHPFWFAQKDLSDFKFHNHYHISFYQSFDEDRQTGEQGLTYTLLNVDGQWLVFDKQSGTPDATLNISVENAAWFFESIKQLDNPTYNEVKKGLNETLYPNLERAVLKR